jgi:hypothetical protein
VTVWDSNQVRRFPCLPEIVFPRYSRRADGGYYSNEATQWPAHLAGPETGQLAAFTYLMDDANAVPGTERNRCPW